MYYDGQTGTYMTYNQDTQKYEFYSQVELPVAEEQKPPDLNVMKTKRKKEQQDSEQVRMFVFNSK